MTLKKSLAVKHEDDQARENAKQISERKETEGINNKGLYKDEGNH